MITPPWFFGHSLTSAITSLIRRCQNPACLGVPAILLGSTPTRAEAFEPHTGQDCRQAAVRITTTDLTGRERCGSGVFLNDGPTTYIYTNAHVLDGADKIRMLDHAGAPVTGIEWIEAMAVPAGLAQGSPDAGDGVRLKLGTRREQALTLSADWASLVPGRALLAVSEDGGANPAVLTGKVLRNSNGILHHDIPPRASASGGAVVDAATFKVVALNTWSVKPSKRADPYLRMLGMEEGSGLTCGLILQNSTWEKFPTKDYLAQQQTIHRLRKNLELMILLSYLVPTANGLHAGHKDSAAALHAQLPPTGTAPFVGGMTLGDAIRRQQDNPQMKRLIELCDKNLKICNADLFRIYLAALDAVLKDHLALLAQLRQARLSGYQQAVLTQQLLSAGDAHYAAWLTDCQAWFQQKTSCHGTIPLKEWETLPPCGAKLAKEIQLKLRAQ